MFIIIEMGMEFCVVVGRDVPQAKNARIRVGCFVDLGKYFVFLIWIGGSSQTCNKDDLERIRVTKPHLVE